MSLGYGPDSGDSGSHANFYRGSGTDSSGTGRARGRVDSIAAKRAGSRWPSTSAGAVFSDSDEEEAQEGVVEMDPKHGTDGQTASFADYNAEELEPKGLN